MNFYDFHIGDYASRTAHLEPMEDLAYRRLLDLYYVREGSLPLDTKEIARLVRLRGQEDTIQAVLAEFFVKGDSGWTHDRCESVIAAAVDKRNKARASAAQRWGNANAMPTHSERIAKAMPTQSEGNAPSPTTQSHSQKKDSAIALLLADGIEEGLANDFIAMRKAKKAPLSGTALKRMKSEALKAGLALRDVIEMCCARGWAGFEAKWVLEGKATPNSTVPPSADAGKALEKIKADAAQAAPPSLETRARLAELRRPKEATV